jgi:hypothetical protein
MRHTGQCHCGANRVEFETSLPLAPRQCQCGFCRGHNVRMVSDPDGAARLTLGPETHRYRFATGTTDYLICGRCGVYVGALAEVDGRSYATLNLNAFDDPRLDLAAEPVSYEGETAGQKTERRRRKWTPALLLAS